MGEYFRYLKAKKPATRSIDNVSADHIRSLVDGLNKPIIRDGTTIFVFQPGNLLAEKISHLGEKEERRDLNAYLIRQQGEVNVIIRNEPRPTNQIFQKITGAVLWTAEAVKEVLYAIGEQEYRNPGSTTTFLPK